MLEEKDSVQKKIFILRSKCFSQKNSEMFLDRAKNNKLTAEILGMNGRNSTSMQM